MIFKGKFIDGKKGDLTILQTIGRQWFVPMLLLALTLIWIEYRAAHKNLDLDKNRGIKVTTQAEIVGVHTKWYESDWHFGFKTEQNITIPMSLKKSDFEKPEEGEKVIVSFLPYSKQVIEWTDI